ncbi:MAG: sodium:solute symporter [candidate division KSB1 bacterium]|nr:sodium:solute symporter [candidate division KSB1 bacterium]
MPDYSLHWLDWIVVAISLILSIAVGAYFARRQKSTQKYFAAEGNLPSWAVGISILATLISSVTFLAYPGEGYSSNWIRLVQGLMVPIVLIFMVWFVVPLYRNVIRLSAYEYFERRFGFLARLYSSLAFVLAHFSKMGTVFFLLALALSKMMHVNTFAIIWVLGLSVVILTVLGGIEAVIWLDVIQGIMLMAGGLLCAAVLLFKPEGGPMAVIGYALEHDKIGFGPYDIDFARLTFIVMALNGVFYAIQKYGTDQTIVQRYLTARSDKEAVRASLLGVFLSVPVWTLFMFIGTALYSYYHLTQAPLPPGTRADAVFPYFIMTELPIGVTGLILAALMAAAISSLDSDMNCLAAIGVEDYYMRFRPKATDRQRLLVGKILVAVSGIAACVVASFYVLAGNKGVLGIVFTLYAIFSGGIAGMFLLGLFTRANKQGLYIGMAACVVFTGWAVLTSTPIGFGENKRLLLDLGRFNFTHHKYMLGVYSHLVLFGVGYLASFLFPHSVPDRSLTIHAWLDKRAETRRQEKAAKTVA